MLVGNRKIPSNFLINLCRKGLQNPRECPRTQDNDGGEEAHLMLNSLARILLGNMQPSCVSIKRKRD